MKLNETKLAEALAGNMECHKPGAILIYAYNNHVAAFNKNNPEARILSKIDLTFELDKYKEPKKGSTYEIQLLDLGSRSHFRNDCIYHYMDLNERLLPLRTNNDVAKHMLKHGKTFFEDLSKWDEMDILKMLSGAEALKILKVIKGN